MSPSTNPALHSQVTTIYKALLHLSTAYPLGHTYFRRRLHQAFWSNRDIVDEAEIKRCIERAEFVKKEIEALYYLKRYRVLRRRYNGL